MNQGEPGVSQGEPGANQGDPGANQGEPTKKTGANQGEPGASLERAWSEPDRLALGSLTERNDDFTTRLRLARASLGEPGASLGVGHFVRCFRCRKFDAFFAPSVLDFWLRCGSNLEPLGSEHRGVARGRLAFYSSFFCCC